MKYVQGAIGLPLIPSIDKYINIKWYVDAEFAVYNDMRIHTGGFMTMVTDGSYVMFRKKMNTKNSTESELVGVEDVLTQVIWTRYFLKEQGYDIHEKIIYQDNHSAIKLDKNGILSSIKWT